MNQMGFKKMQTEVSRLRQLKFSVRQFKFSGWRQRLEPYSVHIWLVSAALIVMVTFFSRPERIEQPQASAAGIDTFIPKGQVLVPISVQNFESLDSIFGQFGYVDLYAVGPNGRRREEPDARSVKLLRAPKNPQQFGILVPSAKASAIVRAGAEFFVVIRSQNAGTEFEMPKVYLTKPKARIVYDEGDNP